MAHGDQRARKRRLRGPTRPAPAKDMPPHLQWLAPRLLLSTMILGVATPVEAAVPLIRTAQGKRGVQCGPAIASLLSVTTGLALAERVEKHPDASLPGEFSFTAVLVAGGALPAVAAMLSRTVVLRERSPLWGWALFLAVRLTTGLVLAEGVGRAKRRLDDAVP